MEMLVWEERGELVEHISRVHDEAMSLKDSGDNHHVQKYLDHANSLLTQTHECWAQVEAIAEKEEALGVTSQRFAALGEIEAHIKPFRDTWGCALLSRQRLAEYHSMTLQDMKSSQVAEEHHELSQQVHRLHHELKAMDMDDTAGPVKLAAATFSQLVEFEEYIPLLTSNIIDWACVEEIVGETTSPSVTTVREFLACATALQPGAVAKLRELKAGMAL